MSFQCGIVGLPNCGKSTLFSALTHTQVHTDIYPFTTIDPNIGLVTVPDDRLTKLSEILQSEKVIPTTIRFVDIAGLIEGSHKGEGLGNRFLAQIREVDAIIHLVRCFTSDQVTHLAETLDPARDIEIVETEIILKDLESVANRQKKVAAKIKGNDEEAIVEMEFLNKITQNLNRGTPIGKMSLNEENLNILQNLFLLSAKPVLYVGNENEEETSLHQTGKASDSLLLWGKQASKRVLILSAVLEQELVFLEDNAERQFFMEEWDLKMSGLESLIRESYALLNLVTFFTSESNHAQAWTVKKDTVAPQAAGIIHTDFEKGFISAEVYSCHDLFTRGSESALREHGLIHTHGKDYVIQDGDVVKYKFHS